MALIALDYAPHPDSINAMTTRKESLAKAVAVLICFFWVVVFILIGVGGFLPMALLFAVCQITWSVMKFLGRDESAGSTAPGQKNAPPAAPPKPKPQPFAGFQDIPAPKSSQKEIKQITHQS